MTRSGTTCDELAREKWVSLAHLLETTETPKTIENKRLIFTHRIQRIPSVSMKMSISRFRHKNCFNRNG